MFQHKVDNHKEQTANLLKKGEGKKGSGNYFQDKTFFFLAEIIQV